MFDNNFFNRLIRSLVTGVELQGDYITQALLLNTLSYRRYIKKRSTNEKSYHMSTIRPPSTSTVVSPIGTPIWSTIKRFLSSELSMLANET